MEELTEREQGIRSIVLDLVISIPSFLLLFKLGLNFPAKGLAILILVLSFGSYKFLRGIVGYISNG